VIDDIVTASRRWASAAEARLAKPLPPGTGFDADGTPPDARL